MFSGGPSIFIGTGKSQRELVKSVLGGGGG